MPNKNRFNTSFLAEGRLMKYIVRLAVVLVVGTLGIFLYLNMQEKQETDTERGIARLQELESIDVAETEKTIRGLREQSRTDEMTSNEDLTSTLKGDYLDASILVLGDSSAQLLLDYDILDDSCVMAAVGSGVATCGSTVNTAVAMVPQKVVLNYGLDDMVYFEGDAQDFIAGYESVIQTVREDLPRAEIYVCEITPVAADALDAQPEYANVDAFNEALRRVCQSQNVNFMETADLIDEYATDGIHPAYAYYVAFAERVLQLAGGKDANGQAGDGNE